MPSTVNGIGTHYYGKKNLEKRPGVCEHCGAAVELRSYETRLWFVAVFIPVIPLGRKQILDYCPKCTWHRSVPVAEWERVRDESIQTTAARASEMQDDPEAAMELHATLVSFRRKDEADQVARVLADRFGDRSDVQLHLGSWHEHRGADAEADACFAKALELEPDNRAARRAVAMAAIQQGDVGRADDLLDFMRQPGDDQDPAVLVLLANAHQDQGDHQAALDLYRIALGSAPDLAREKAIRKRVAASERALARPESILPRKGVSRWKFVWAAILLAVVIGIFGLNQYRAGRQTLHVVNGLPHAIVVTIDGERIPTLRAGAWRVVPIAEGQHLAVIAHQDAPGQAIDTVNFEIRNAFFERFESDNAFILNPRGAAILLWQEITYSDPPLTHEPPHRVLTGKSFETLRDVDYVLQTAPASLRVESGSKPVKKTELTVFAGTPMEALSLLPESLSMDQLADFLEHRLSLDPTDVDLLRLYVAVGQSEDLATRVEAFLGRGLAARPVNIDWHRFYQEFRTAKGERDALTPLYDRFLAREAGDAALLYLRGRLCDDPAEAVRYYGRAIAADKANAYPWFAKAWQERQGGDFAAARKSAAEAARLQPENAEMADAFFEVRYALGEYDPLLETVQKGLGQTPLNFQLHRRRMELLAAKGELPMAEAAHQEYAREVNAQMADDPLQLIVYSRCVLRYLQGRMDDWLAEARKIEGAEASALEQFAAHVELGQPAEAEKAAGASPAGVQCVLLHLAWLRQDKADSAQRWLDRAVDTYADGTPRLRPVGEILKKGRQVTAEDIVRFDAPFTEKVPALVALAAACEARRAELLDLAEKLNFARAYPHRFLRATIAELRRRGNE